MHTLKFRAKFGTVTLHFWAVTTLNFARNSGLTLNQIANIALGNGNSRNAGIVGRTLNEFIAYFYPPKIRGYNWRVNWTIVQRDHPHLIDSKNNQTKAGSQHASPLQGMKQALDDEIREVRRESEANPIKALGADSLGAIGDGSFLYEAVIELSGDTELPIPEGVDIRLRWNRHIDPFIMDATLLSYEALKSTIIFEVARPLSKQHLNTDFVVLPRIEELLRAIQSKVLTLASDEHALSWKLLRAELEPQRKPWAHALNRIGLDDAQLYAVEQCLSQDITFLWGPPGTGKTHTLSRLMAMAALGGQKIIATAIANVAVDQMAIGLVRALENVGREGQQLLTGGRILRFGHPRLPEVSGEAKSVQVRLAHSLNSQLSTLNSQLSFERGQIFEKTVESGEWRIDSESSVPILAALI